MLVIVAAWSIKSGCGLSKVGVVLTKTLPVAPPFKIIFLRHWYVCMYIHKYVSLILRNWDTICEVPKLKSNDSRQTQKKIFHYNRRTNHKTFILALKLCESIIRFLDETYQLNVMPSETIHHCMN